MIYYFLYLKHKLMQEEYLERDNFSAYEIQGWFNEYTSLLVNQFKIDGAKVNDELKQFLTSKEITITREQPATPSAAPPPIPTQAPAPIEKAQAAKPVDEEADAEPFTAKKEDEPSDDEPRSKAADEENATEPDDADREEKPAYDEDTKSDEWSGFSR